MSRAKLSCVLFSRIYAWNLSIIMFFLKGQKYGTCSDFMGSGAHVCWSIFSMTWHKHSQNFSYYWLWRRRRENDRKWARSLPVSGLLLEEPEMVAPLWGRMMAPTSWNNWWWSDLGWCFWSTRFNPASKLTVRSLSRIECIFGSYLTELRPLVPFSLKLLQQKERFLFLRIKSCSRQSTKVTLVPLW